MECDRDIVSWLKQFKHFENLRKMLEQEEEWIMIRCRNNNLTSEEIKKYTENLRCKIDELVSYKNDILNVIDKVSDPLLKQILFLKYVKGYSVEKIADEIYYSERNIWRLLNEAYDELEKIIASESETK